MSKFCLFFIFIVVLSACTGKKSTEELIVGDKGFNYWMMIDDDSIQGFDYLDKNGKWLVFVIEDGAFEKHGLPHDVVRIEEWYMKNDSVIVIGESSVNEILKLTKDTMITYSHLWDRESVYIVAPDSLIPEEYRKFQ
ncbi:hypothetical protein M2451_002152 [Dysgonomonas sp. PFB1-18]|uniref:hypothetical protein n=1 Tax=unclassified Dysgonomonas TaxID=2630389 RepID=UPI0024756AB0|nr:MULTISPECIES: hypothetical protein [unclassified Dysgonomonas]MDH6309664.1 hypothetical protein [Dysgonomonas sp. PF1-14]MDH6339328.1 hypothetical protein [Dysgonomonas sp. PF1-16]MDH6380827.1 hypothetical protein [Dysgonomonas sp. PFB1-18]MDH6398323.1 hypothetical protein [Dysgonomonas sp. PF1-23]